MTDHKGYIIQITKKYAIIMTNKCQFLVVERPPGMMPGRHILFKYDCMAPQKFMKYLAAACVMLLLISAALFDHTISENKIYAYVSVDVNPSVEFAVDRELMVEEVVPLDEAAVTFLKEIKVQGLSLKSAVAEMVKGFELLENPVVISVSIAEHQLRKLSISEDQALEDILSTLSDVTVDPILMKVSSKDRETAAKNKISMGRFALYNMIKEKNGSISLAEARMDSMTELCAEADIDTGYYAESETEIADIADIDNSQNNKEAKEKALIKAKSENAAVGQETQSDETPVIPIQEEPPQPIIEENLVAIVEPKEPLEVEEAPNIIVTPEISTNENIVVTEDQNSSKNKSKNNPNKTISNRGAADKNKEK